MTRSCEFIHLDVLGVRSRNGDDAERRDKRATGASHSHALLYYVSSRLLSPTIPLIVPSPSFRFSSSILSDSWRTHVLPSLLLLLHLLLLLFFLLLIRRSFLWASTCRVINISSRQIDRHNSNLLCYLNTRPQTHIYGYRYYTSHEYLCIERLYMYTRYILPCFSMRPARDLWPRAKMPLRKCVWRYLAKITFTVRRPSEKLHSTGAINRKRLPRVYHNSWRNSGLSGFPLFWIGIPRSFSILTKTHIFSLENVKSNICKYNLYAEIV